MKNTILIISLLFLWACSNESKVRRIEELYNKNKQSYFWARDFLMSEESNVRGLYYYNDEIWVKYSNEEKPLSKVKSSDRRLSKLIAFFKDNDLKNIYGRKDWGLRIMYSFGDECLKFSYSPGFNPNTEIVKSKVDNFKKGNKYDWLYIVDNNWYIITDCD